MSTKGRIRAWPHGERPREILKERGSSHLSDAQLLAVLFRTGTASPPASALDLGLHTLRAHPTLADLDRATFHELLRIRGLGQAKAASLKAALELGRRLMARESRPRPRFSGSREVAGYFTPSLSNLPKEVFLIVLLNGRNEIIRELTVSVGCLTSSLVHPREVFQPAVRDSAAAVILVHNHPSGDPTPSTDDLRLTERLVEAGAILGIKVLDHVIVASGGYVSLLEDRRSKTH